MSAGQSPGLNTAVDIGRLVDYGRWTTFQKGVLALTGLAIVFDGMDLQLLAFAIPTLMHDWSAPRSAFAPILAGGIVAMALGTVLGGWFGDRLGRRNALAFSLMTFGLATLASGFVGGLAGLGILRFVAGAGLGAAMPNAAALTAEFTPLQRRPLAVAVTMVCVPVGGLVAGLIAAPVLQGLGWQWLFFIGGSAASLLAGVIRAALPESPRFLVRHPERRSELRRLAARLGYPSPDSALFIDPAEQEREAGSFRDALFGRPMLPNTLGLWAAFFSSMLAVYLALNWLPTLLAAQGFGVADASSGLAAWNFAGIFSAFICAGLINNFGSRIVMSISCLGGLVSAAFLWRWPPLVSGGLPIVAIAVHGFFANGVQTSMYALAASVYPTRVRARGVAAAVAVARAGALSSALAGAALVQEGAAPYFAAIALALAAAMVTVNLVSDHIPRFTNYAVDRYTR
jgi:AAHS family 4-hydroxybenzoate transporter-like MFS transporter